MNHQYPIQFRHGQLAVTGRHPREKFDVYKSPHVPEYFRQANRMEELKDAVSGTQLNEVFPPSK
jgi:hypothetical protein